MVVSGERLFEPAHVVRLQSRHHLPHVGDVVPGVGIDEDRQLIAKRLTHRRNALEVGGRRVTKPELDRLVAGLDERPDLVDQRIGLLKAERHSAGVGRNRPAGSAEQLVYGPTCRLAPYVP